MKKLAYSTMLPLAFAAFGNALPNNLEKISSENSKIFNQSLSNPDYKEIPAPIPQKDEIANKYDFGTKTYDIVACLGDVFEFDKVRYKYSHFDKRSNLTTNWMLPKFPGMEFRKVQPPMEGGYRIKMSEEIPEEPYNDPYIKVKEYSIVHKDPTFSIKRTYEQKVTSDMFDMRNKKNCFNARIKITDKPNNDPRPVQYSK